MPTVLLEYKHAIVDSKIREGFVVRGEGSGGGGCGVRVL